MEAGAGEAPVIWTWSGAVTSSSAVVKAKVGQNIKKVDLILSDQPDFSHSDTGTESVSAIPDSDGIVTFKLKHLAADTLFYYSVVTEGSYSLNGRFQTFNQGPMSFRIGFASCASTGSNHQIWDTIASQNPLFFLHMGDFHYEDIVENDPVKYRRAFDRCLTSPRQGALYRHTSIAYIWDDHDFGPNDADGASPGKPAALRTYSQYVPHYPLVTGADAKVHTIQQAFTVGRVRFIMTDVRAERSPADISDGPQKSMLGQEQRAWLDVELTAAANDNYALIVWVNVVPWITKSSPGGDHGWESYSWERRLIADRIKELNLVDRLLVLSGDGHMVAIDDGTNSNYASSQEPGERAFPVVHAAPIHRYPRVKGGPYSHGTYARKRLFGALQENQFGLMSVKDNGEILEVELKGLDSEGRLLDNMILELRCHQGKCEPLSDR